MGSLIKFLKGKHFLNNFILKSNNPRIFLGKNILTRIDGIDFISGLNQVVMNFSFSKNLINLINSSVSFIGFNQIGLQRGKFDFKQISNLDNGKNTFLEAGEEQYTIFEQGILYYLLGLKEFYFKKEKELKEYVVYQGHHAPKITRDIDMILPGVTFLEQTLLL